MPWCDTCARFWNPSTVPPDGVCPTCGRPLGRPAAPEGISAKELDLKELAGEEASAPWHFKLLVVLVVIYLVWRIVDLLGLV